MLFRILLVSLFLYGLSDIHVHKEVKLSRGKKKFYFLTTIGLIFTTITEMMALLKIKYVEDLIALSFILESFVTFVFWILIFINQDFMRSKDSKGKTIKNNLLKELCLHLLPFLCLAWEHFNFKIVYHIKLQIIINFLIIAYHLILLHYYKKHKEHLYPILTKIDKLKKIVLSSSSFLVVNLLFFILSKIYHNSL